MTPSLRFIVNPSLSIVKYEAEVRSNPTSASLESVLGDSVDRCISFLTDHVYELFSIYGEEYQDLISEIPDPIAEPLEMLKDLR